jgi:hypothetical protein
VGESVSLCLFYLACQAFLVRQDGFSFDLDSPFRIKESGDHHRGGGANGAKDFAVRAADLFPVFSAGEEDAGADDVSKWISGGAGLGEGFFDEGEDGAGLFGGRQVFCTDRTGAGDVDDVADADGAGEADDGLVRRGAGDVGAVHDEAMIGHGGCKWFGV